MSKLFTLPSIIPAELNYFFAFDSNEHRNFEPLSLPLLTCTPEYLFSFSFPFDTPFLALPYLSVLEYLWQPDEHPIEGSSSETQSLRKMA